MKTVQKEYKKNVPKWENDDVLLAKDVDDLAVAVGVAGVVDEPKYVVKYSTVQYITVQDSTILYFVQYSKKLVP